jgi:hypothetical protein
VEGVGDRDAHVGIPEVRERGTVVQLDQRVHDRLRVHDDVDPIERHPEEVHRLDHLEALVHQSGGVDRDLSAHVPGRMRERLLAGHVSHLVRAAAAERASGRREDQPVDRAGALLGVHELEQRRVLGVHRDHLGARGLG